MPVSVIFFLICAVTCDHLAMMQRKLQGSVEKVRDACDAFRFGKQSTEVDDVSNLIQELVGLLEAGALGSDVAVVKCEVLHTQFLSWTKH